MTRILTGTADVTAGSPNVVWHGDPLSVANCPPDSPITLNSKNYFVKSLTDTTHVVLTRPYNEDTAVGVASEISGWTAAEVQTATLNQRTAQLLQSLAVPLTGVPMVFGGVVASEADPGTGKITFDDADAPTVMRISKTSYGGYGPIDGILAALDDSTNAVARSIVSLRPTDGANTFVELGVTGAVTDHTTYVAVPISLTAGVVPANGAKLALSAVPSGNDGTNGIFSAIASQAEAEAGTDNTKGMSPLRTAQAIAALVGTVSAFAKTLLDDTTAAAALTTLGVSAFAQTLLDDTSGAAAFTTMGSAQSLGNSGYVKLPGGVIIQWGLIGTGATDRAVVYPVAFSTVGVPVAAPFDNGATDSANSFVSLVAVTGFTIRNRTSNTGVGQNMGNMWIAVGY